MGDKKKMTFVKASDHLLNSPLSRLAMQTTFYLILKTENEYQNTKYTYSKYLFMSYWNNDNILI